MSEHRDALMRLARPVAGRVACPRCGAAPGVECRTLPLIMGERWNPGDPHTARVRAAITPEMNDQVRRSRAADRARLIDGPPPTTPRDRARLALALREAQQAERAREWEAGAEARRAAREADNERRHVESRARIEHEAERVRRAEALDHWRDDDPIGKKRQRLVRWLLRKGVALSEARLIAVRKYPQDDD